MVLVLLFMSTTLMVTVIYISLYLIYDYFFRCTIKRIYIFYRVNTNKILSYFKETIFDRIIYYGN